jgi:hypothetical protein
MASTATTTAVRSFGTLPSLRAFTAATAAVVDAEPKAKASVVDAEPKASPTAPVTPVVPAAPTAATASAPPAPTASATVTPLVAAELPQVDHTAAAPVSRRRRGKRGKGGAIYRTQTTNNPAAWKAPIPTCDSTAPWVEDKEQELREAREEHRAALRRAIQAKRNGRVRANPGAAAAAASGETSSAMDNLDNLSTEDLIAARNMAIRAGLLNASSAPSARKLKRAIGNMDPGKLATMMAARA